MNEFEIMRAIAALDPAARARVIAWATADAPEAPDGSGLDVARTDGPCACGVAQDVFHPKTPACGRPKPDGAP